MYLDGVEDQPKVTGNSTIRSRRNIALIGSFADKAEDPEAPYPESRKTIPKKTLTLR